VQRTLATIKVEQKISGNALIEQIQKSSEAQDSGKIADIRVRPDDPTATDWTEDSNARFTSWKVNIDRSEEDAAKILNQLQSDMAKTIVWRSSEEVGASVAGGFKLDAIFALLTSLLGIIGYIWIRFQRVVFGLAAVVALLHDIMVTLGAIALSYWLASVFGVIGIDEFKISLTVVAAFLTIIGYSLNDTIVVFDRIREVRGKNPELTDTMVNTSINQTLSRTLLTSITTFLVVVILYAFGGEGIHAFAFTLVIGVLVGTYSSIFVASPALLWMMELTQVKKPNRGGKPPVASAK